MFNKSLRNITALIIFTLLFSSIPRVFAEKINTQLDDKDQKEFNLIKENSKIKNLAQQLNEKVDQKNLDQFLKDYNSLSEGEEFAVSKLWRDAFVSSTDDQKVQNKKADKLQRELLKESRKIANKTVNQLSQSEYNELEVKLKQNKNLEKIAFAIENKVDNLGLFDNIKASAAGGDCTVFNFDGTRATAEWSYDSYYSPTAWDRAKNDPNENPCDFRIFTTLYTMNRVDGLNYATYIAVSYGGGVDGYKNFQQWQRFIVGYWRTAGIAFNGQYLFDRIQFRKR
jgi:hypothetical protein